MKIIEPSYEILTPISRSALGMIELAGRTCYKSEGSITPDSAGPFVKKIANVYKHESVIEHSSLTVKFVCDRGVSHELVRHRLCAFSQESTRYCNYSKEKFGREITVIRPPFWEPCDHRSTFWQLACESAEAAYFSLIDHGGQNSCGSGLKRGRECPFRHRQGSGYPIWSAVSGARDLNG